MKFAAIAAETTCTLAIRAPCEALGVTEQGYYLHIGRGLPSCNSAGACTAVQCEQQLIPTWAGARCRWWFHELTFLRRGDHSLGIAKSCGCGNFAQLR